jgi:Protein of unknown function (DUF2569)
MVLTAACVPVLFQPGERNSVGRAMNELRNPERALVAAGPTAAKVPCGIGGWLLVVAFGQLLGLLLMFVALGRMFFDPDALQGFEQFPLASYGELGFNLALALLTTTTAILFFRKSRHFPRVFICGLVAAFVLPALSVVWTALTLSAQLGKPLGVFLELEPQEIAQFMATIVAALIWIPYTLKSKRVRNTFVAQDDPLHLETQTVSATPAPRVALLRTVVVIIIVTGSVSVMVGLGHTIGRGAFSGNLLGGVLQISLAIWLFRGSDVARIILAALFFIGFVFALGLPVLAVEREPLLIVVAAGMAIVAGLCFWILAFSQRLRAELAMNEARYRKPDLENV